MLVGEEVATASHFGQRLETADERDEIERRVQCAAEHSFSADGGADRDQRHGAAHPRQRSCETARQSSAGITPELLWQSHIEDVCKLYSVEPTVRALAHNSSEGNQMTNFRCWTNRSATYLMAFALSASWSLWAPVDARAQTALQNQRTPAKSWREQHPLLFPTLIGTAAGAAAGCALAAAVDNSEEISCGLLAAGYGLLGAAVGVVPGLVTERRNERDPVSFDDVRHRVRAGTNVIGVQSRRQIAGKVVEVTADSVTMRAMDGTTTTLAGQSSTWHLTSDSLKNGMLIGAAVGAAAAVVNYKDGASAGGAITGVPIWALIGTLVDRAIKHQKLVVGEPVSGSSASVKVLPWLGRRSGGIAVSTSF